MTETADWNWTEKSSQTIAGGSSQSASFVVGGPAYGYKDKPSQLAIYFDTIYKTFAFELIPVEQEQIALEGTAVTSQGAPLAGKPVTLTERGIKYTTFTDSTGKFHFVGNLTGPVTVEAEGIVQTAPAVQPMKRTIQITTP